MAARVQQLLPRAPLEISPRKRTQSPDEEAGNRWKAVEEMDKVLDCLEGRLDRITAVIQSTSVQEKLLASAQPLKWRSARARGFLGRL
jgi:hypothetical protein